MSVVMERIRLVILTDDDLRAAIRLAAAKQRKQMSVVAEEALRKAFATELSEGRAAKETEKKGRSPKE